MAYSNDYRENRKHAFETISEDIKSGNIGNVLFLRGVEQYLVTWSCEILVKKYVNEATSALDLVKFDPDNFDVERVIEACETVPMFSERKVVLIDNFYFMWGKAPKDIFGENQKKTFIEYLSEMPTTTLLIIAAPEPEDFNTQKYGNAVSKALDKVGTTYKFEALQERQLLAFMKKRIKAGGKIAGRNAMNMLISESGYYNKEIDYGLYNLDNDLKKIIALSEGEEITVDDVEKGVSDNLEHNTFKLLDSISNNRKDEAFRLIRELLLTGHDEFELLGSILGQLELMLEVKEMRALAMSLPQIKSALKIHEFRIKKAMGFSGGYSVAQIKKMLKMAFEVEKNIKSGTLKGEMALEMLVAGI